MPLLEYLKAFGSLGDTGESGEGGDGNRLAPTVQNAQDWLRPVWIWLGLGE